MSDHYPSMTLMYSCLAALNFIAEISPAESPIDSSRSLPQDPFKLPSIPSESEFDWVCKPPPSSRAITQGQTFKRCERSLKVMFPLRPAGHQEAQQRADGDSSPEAAQDPSHDLSGDPVLNPALKPVLNLCPSSGPDKGPCRAHRLGGRHRFYRTDSDEGSEDNAEEGLTGGH